MDGENIKKEIFIKNEDPEFPFIDYENISSSPCTSTIDEEEELLLQEHHPEHEEKGPKIVGAGGDVAIQNHNFSTEAGDIKNEISVKEENIECESLCDKTVSSSSNTSPVSVQGKFKVLEAFGSENVTEDQRKMLRDRKRKLEIEAIYIKEDKEEGHETDRKHLPSCNTADGDMSNAEGTGRGAMMSPLSDEDLNLLALCAVALCSSQKEMKKRKRKRKWSKNWLLNREKVSQTCLMNELQLGSNDWFNHLRMDESTYLTLLSMVTPLIEKQDTCMRKSITAHERLSATLRFLATGKSYENLKFTVAISAQALSHIIPDTCHAIWKSLQKEYIKFPDGGTEWTQIAADYQKMWDFPHCIGAVGGRHVAIARPPGDSSQFYNYKGHHSVVLMAIVNANHEFMMCDFGVNGGISDGGVEDTTFYEKLSNSTLKIPPARIFGDLTTPLPFVFVGDEAFRLRKHFMKPFSQRELTHDSRIFNYRLARAHCVIKNVFDVMSMRFGIFNKPLNVSIKKMDPIVMSCCALHNFLHKSRGESYMPYEILNIPDENTDMHTIPQSFFVNLAKRDDDDDVACDEAKNVRNMFMQYFSGEGAAVPCQKELIIQDTHWEY